MFSVTDHGEIPLNKQGESKTIPAQTTIIGTFNPKNINASWKTGKISKDEIPLHRALVDRFDITLKFEDEDTEESVNNYALYLIRYKKPILIFTDSSKSKLGKNIRCILYNALHYF